MLTSTTETIAGYKVVETLGLVKGNTIRARHIGNDIIASLRTIIGGEINEYTKMMAESREQAYDRLLLDAKMKGADAVIGLKFETSTVLAGAAELLCYGTAVKLEEIK